MKTNLISRCAACALSVAAGALPWIAIESALGATTQKGGLIVNEIWNAEGSPICLTNDVTLSNVTILPGTVVHAGSNVTIQVLTTVRAIGTSNAPIVFEPAPDNASGWQGFYFENTVPGSEFDWCHIRGARNSGLRLIRSTPLIRNTVFSTNSGSFGGAIYVDLSGGDLLITNCAFINNRAANDGGAIWARTGTGRLDIAQSRFNQNVANPGYSTRDTYGGAVCLQGNANVVQCEFSRNSAHAYTIFVAGGRYVRGGAFYASGGTYTFAACRFMSNSVFLTAHGQTPDASRAYGGAVFCQSGAMTLRNCLLAENSVSAERWPDLRGSAIFLQTGGLDGLNLTIVRNRNATAIQNAGGTAMVKNSIVYFNYDNANQIVGQVAITYSDVQAGWPGQGNINFNPALDAEYCLLSGSPAIDAGDPSPTYNDTFPPGLGIARNDMGFKGGPGGPLWVQSNTSPPQDIFRVDIGHLVLWIDRPELRLEHAVEVTGPWVAFPGETLTIGNQRAVLIDQLEPRRFFRLVKVLP